MHSMILNLKKTISVLLNYQIFVKVFKILQFSENGILQLDLQRSGKYLSKDMIRYCQELLLTNSKRFERI